MSILLNTTVLNELRAKIRKHPLLSSRDANVEIFILSLIDKHFPTGNELKTTRTKDIVCSELEKVFRELDSIVNAKKKAAK